MGEIRSEKQLKAPIGEDQPSDAFQEKKEKQTDSYGFARLLGETRPTLLAEDISIEAQLFHRGKSTERYRAPIPQKAISCPENKKYLTSV